jgi:hypothetical protein
MAMPDDTGEWRSQSAQGVFAGEGSIGRGGAAMVSGVFEFLSYDSANNSATLVSPEGNVLVVDVAPEMRAFAQSRSPGDRILISYAFANAIELELTEPS